VLVRSGRKETIYDLTAPPAVLRLCIIKKNVSLKDTHAPAWLSSFLSTQTFWKKKKEDKPTDIMKWH